jgi:uncharacterized membrane protein HdeD (DUF308 family)
MPLLLAGNWWAIALRGVCGILFGLGAIFWPGIALAALVLLFGAYAFADGVLAIVSAVRAGAKHERWVALAFEGVFGIIVGIWSFMAPAVTIVVLVVVVAIWALITGILEIVAALRLRETIKGEWVLGLIGVASILFGTALAIVPLAGALVLAIWIGSYAFVAGVLQLMLALKLRNWLRSAGAEQDQRLAA